MKSILIFLLLLLSSAVHGRKISVRPGHLRAAVAAAKDGDSLFLQAGLYKEGPITLTRSLTLIGTGEVILDGEYKQEILVISGYHISIRNLQL